MPDRSFLAWPFFDDSHRRLAEQIRHWVEQNVDSSEPKNPDEECAKLVLSLARDGWLRHAVPVPYGTAPETLDVRTLCLIRETLAYRSGLADFAFAMQGLGSGPISLFGSSALKNRYLGKFASGEMIGAFAISEAGAGSDLRAMQASARSEGADYIVNGTKTWISNAGLATVYMAFFRFPQGGEKSFLALAVPADTPGISVDRLEIIAPHPIGTVLFHECRVPRSARIGNEGDGLNIALRCLDVFRPTVGAAALGFARRAVDEAVPFAQNRQAFGQRLSDFQITKAKLAEMAVAIDTSALLVYRSAWSYDVLKQTVTREAAMAKLHATEAAQHVIDEAVQILGARGVLAGSITEQLYREIRSLRIYEGTSTRSAPTTCRLSSSYRSSFATCRNTRIPNA
jgi:acyl-CoA dehydrogenase